MNTAETFSIRFPKNEMDDLMARLRATRYPDQIPNSGWTYGMDTSYLRLLVDYWANNYRYEEELQRLNGYAHFRTEIDGLQIHYIHQTSSAQNAIPILLMHGWPSSFVQMLDLIPLLTMPGRGELAFHVVAASLPGYGYSSIPAEPGFSVARIAPLMHKLMTDVLGYSRYVIRAGDLGAGVGNAIAMRYPQSIIGFHTGGTNPFLSGPIPEDLSPEEAAFVQNAQSWMQAEMAYAQMHSTKPQTVAAALMDSPAGLAAWVGEKFHKWTDNQGRIDDAISLDAFCTNLTIYWLTGTIGSSMRLYYETLRDQGGWGKPQVPVGFLMSSRDMFATPKSWAERQCAISYWRSIEQGGHFLEWEQPGVVAGDIREFLAGIPNA